ncbi:MAG TPA: sodium/proton-translocating pyrophosphatase, partial [Candidatus Peribacteraceae bacterium]|nr:sodium/proton-translocating pyrophosphatase [Candidatus Peribacteraceae bacterium]
MQAFAAYSLFSQSILIVLLSSVFALCAACAFRILLRIKPVGNEKMNAVAKVIRSVALRFLGKEIAVVCVFLLAAALPIYLWIDTGWAGVQAGRWQLPWTTGSFLLGALVTFLGAFVVVQTSTAATLRVTQAARTSFTQAFRIVLLSASTTGFFIAGIGVFGLAGLLFGLLEWGEVTLGASLQMLVAFTAGVSTVALFLRLSGGLFAKAADMSADIAGKAEASMGDDDPRNPAVIADHAGDHLAGVVATSTNLLDNFILAVVAAMFLGVSADLGRLGSNIAVLYPLFIVALAIVTSILGILAIRIKKGSENIFGPLRNGTVVALLLLVLGSFFVGRAFLPSSESLSVFIALVSGILAGTIIQLLAEHALTQGSSTVRSLALTAQTSASTLILRGLFLGHISTFIPVFFVVLAVILANINAGLFGIAMGAVGMLATLGMHVLLMNVGPVGDGANGIAELAALPKQ